MSFSINQIRDGEKTKGYIAAEPGLNDAISFEYRRMTWPAYEQLESDKMEGSMSEGCELTAMEIVKYLYGWDQEFEISFDSIMHLPQMAFRKLYAIISGRLPSDKIPDEKPSQRDERLAELQALKDGQTPQQASEGNS